MAYSDVWDAAFEAHPADAENVSLGAGRIRTDLLSIRERMQCDHYWDPAGTDADHGEHKQITLHAPISTPSAIANKGFVYGKDVDAKIELHYLDEDGNEVQLTAAGGLNQKLGAIPSGTKMLFYQDSAPTGWTIQNTLDDKLVFISKGSVAGGEVGGGAHSTGTWTQPVHAHSVATHWHHAPVGKDGTNLTWNSTPPFGTSGSFSYNRRTDYSASGTGSYMKTSTDGATATGDNATSNTYRPASYVCIICTKD